MGLNAFFLEKVTHLEGAERNPRLCRCSDNRHGIGSALWTAVLAQREARAASCGHTQPHTRRLIHHEAVKRDPKVSLSLTCVPSVVPKPTWKLTLVTAARPCRPCKTVVTQVCEGHRPPALAPRLCLQLVASQSRCLCGTGRSALRLSGTQPAPLSSPELHLLPSSKRMGEGPPLSSLQGLALSTSTLRYCPPGLLPPASLSHSPPSSTQGKKLPAFVSVLWRGLSALGAGRVPETPATRGASFPGRRWWQPSLPAAPGHSPQPVYLGDQTKGTVFPSMTMGTALGSPPHRETFADGLTGVHLFPSRPLTKQRLSGELPGPWARPLLSFTALAT